MDAFLSWGLMEQVIMFYENVSFLSGLHIFILNRLSKATFQGLHTFNDEFALELTNLYYS